MKTPFLRRELDRVVRQLKDRCHPERIILFGSLARGKAQPGSDIDLVVIKRIRKRFFDRLREVALLHDAQQAAEKALKAYLVAHLGGACHRPSAVELEVQISQIDLSSSLGFSCRGRYA